MFANDYNKYWTIYCCTECFIFAAAKMKEGKSE